MDCIVHGVAKSQTRLSNIHFLSPFKGMTLLRYQTRCFIIVSDVMFILYSSSLLMIWSLMRTIHSMQKKKRTLNPYWRKRKKFKCTNIGRFSKQEFVALSNEIHLALQVAVIKFSLTFPTVYSTCYF